MQSGVLQSSGAWQHSATPALAVRSDGTVVCVTCTGVVAFEPSLRQRGGLDATGPAGVVVAHDDSIFAVVPGTDVDTTEIVALEPTGQIRWRSTIGTRTVSVKLIASDDGLYAWAQRFSQMSRLPESTLFAVDTATGALRSMATDVGVIGPAHRGVIGGAATSAPAVAQLDPTGKVVWSHAIGGFIRPALNGSLPTADGGVIVFGTIFGELDLGDLTIPWTPGPVSRGVIIRFDANGATQWGYAVDDGGVTQLVAIAAADPQRGIAGEERFVAAGGRQVGGSMFSPDDDSFLTVATSAGVTRQLTLGGRGIQDLFGIAAAPDGAVWVQLLNLTSADEGDDPPPILEIGDQQFTDSGVLLFKIVP